MAWKGYHENPKVLLSKYETFYYNMLQAANHFLLTPSAILRPKQLLAN